MTALDAIKVIDLSRVLAGPLCTQMLADHGARVIKIEPPMGDETRFWGPPFLPRGSSAYFSAINRNKENISVDLRSKVGVTILHRLLEEADVLVENFKTGTLERWGLPDDLIVEKYPRLVHCRITGFGTDGPMGGAPGYDAVVQAYGGLMSINGDPDGLPTRVGVPIVDMVTGFLAFSGVLLALAEREKSGRGQIIDSTLLDSVTAILHPHATSWLNGGPEPRRTGSAHPTVAPYDVYSAADGLVFLGIGNDRQFREFCEVISMPELADDARFVANGDRVTNYQALKPILAERIAVFQSEDLGKKLLERGIPGSPVHQVSQALDDPQVRHRGAVISDDDRYRGIANPVRLTRTPPQYRWAPREKGENTREVLLEHGFDKAQVDQWISSRIAYTNEDQD